MLYRKADLGPIDLEARSVPVTIASTNPVQRDGYLEILDLASVDLSRGDLPLIESHDADQINLGVVRGIKVVGNKLVGTAVFGTSARASEILADVQAKVVSGLSIGYALIGEGVPGVIDGKPTRTFGFMPYECSVVSCPADLNAGFFRSRKTLSLNQGNIVETQTRNHAAEISAMARAMSLPADLAIRAIEDNATVEQFQQLAIAALSKPAMNTGSGSTSSTTTTMADRTADTTTRVLRNAQDFRDHYATRADFRSGVTLADFLRATARMKSSTEATRALAIGVNADGGYTLPNSVMPRILEALVPVSSLLQAGAGIIPLGEGAKSYSFAAVDTIPTASWRLENGAVAESAPTFKTIPIVPKSLSFMIKVSRELLADAPNVEAALQTAIAQAFAVEIDRVGLMGSGINPQPLGLKGTAGIQTVTNGTDGALLAGYANILAGVEKIITANAGMPTAAIMAPRSLVRLGGLVDTLGQPLEVPNLIAGVKLLATSQVPVNLTVGTSSDASEIYLGDFSGLLIAMREALSVQVLTEAFADHGQICWMCHARLDILVQYPAAFALISGVR